MDTSNSLNVTVYELEASDHVEDRRLAKHCAEVIAELIERLRPIIAYITVRDVINWTISGHERPVLTKYVRVCHTSVEDLFLSEYGNFFKARCRKSEKPSAETFSSNLENFLKEGTDCWKLAIFSTLITGLRNALAEAEEKRAKHLAAVSSRRKMLDEMMAILKKPSTT